MNKKIVIIGASGHGKVVANIAKLNGYEEIIFLDDDVNKKSCGQYQVVGTSNCIDLLIAQYYDFAVAIGDNEIRKRVYKKLVSKKAIMPILIHPTAVIDETVCIGSGTIIMANVVINASSIVGEACIINTASSIDHDCFIGDYTHISPNVGIAGGVSIGIENWIGIGTSIINNISIYDNCLIGASSTILKSILVTGTYVGSPARKVK